MPFSVEIIEPRLFAGVVADELVASVHDIEAEQDICSLALAGGSTPAETYRLLSHPPRVSDINWAKIKLFFGDERWVPASDAQSNYKMVQETLLARLPSNDWKIYPVDTSLSTPDEAAKAYEDIIRKEVPAGPQGIPAFDIILLGIGADGHIASIFRDSTVFSEKTALYRVVKQPWDDNFRISITPRMILAARRIIILAKGKNKAEVVKQVLEGHDTALALPGRLLLDHPGNVNWFVDSEAGQYLSRK